MTRRCPLRKRNRLVDVGPHKHHFCICHLRPKAPRQTAISSLHISKISRAALTWPSSPADSMPSSDLVGKRSIYVKVLNVSLVYLQVIVSVPFINAVTHIRSPHQFAPGMSFARDRLAIAEHTRSTKGVVQIMATLEDGVKEKGARRVVLAAMKWARNFPYIALRASGKAGITGWAHHGSFIMLQMQQRGFSCGAAQGGYQIMR